MSPLRAFARLWTAPVRPEPLAAFRIALAAVMLADLAATVAPRLAEWLGPEGRLPADGFAWWRDAQGRPALPAGLPMPAVWALFAAWAASLAGVLLGVRTRACTVAAWVLTLLFHNSLAGVTNGADRLARCGLFLLMFSRAGAAWSWDARGGRGEPAVPAWPLRLMQIQFAAVYLFSGLGKLISADGRWRTDWLDGSAVYWILGDACVPRVPYEWLAMPLWVRMPLGWAVVGAELAFPLLMLWGPTRRWGLAAGASLHIGIFALLEVGAFSWVMLAWYPLFLLPSSAAGADDGAGVRPENPSPLPP